MEYPKYRVHLKGLDADSRYLRFGYAITDELIDKICDTIEKEPHKHILFCVEDDQLNFIAIGHIALENEMELAFSVLKEHQGNGLGSALMERCIQWCRTNNKLHGFMVCLASNRVIRHLCQKHGIKLHNDGGEMHGDLDFEEPNLTTFVKEGLESNLGFFDYMSKRAKMLWTFNP